MVQIFDLFFKQDRQVEQQRKIKSDFFFLEDWNALEIDKAPILVAYKALRRLREKSKETSKPLTDLLKISLGLEMFLRREK